MKSTVLEGHKLKDDDILLWGASTCHGLSELRALVDDDNDNNSSYNRNNKSEDHNNSDSRNSRIIDVEIELKKISQKKN